MIAELAGYGVHVWDPQVHEANIEQLEFQLAAFRRQERRRLRHETRVLDTALRGVRQIMIKLLGLDLTIPKQDRRIDGRGPAVPLALISNSPEVLKHLDDQMHRSQKERDATEDERKERYAKARLEESLGRDSGDEHAKLDARLASLSLQDLKESAFNEEVYTEQLRRAGIETQYQPAEAFEQPKLDWDEAREVERLELERRNKILSEASSDRLMDHYLGELDFDL